MKLAKSTRSPYPVQSAHKVSLRRTLHGGSGAGTTVTPEEKPQPPTSISNAVTTLDAKSTWQQHFKWWLLSCSTSAVQKSAVQSLRFEHFRKASRLSEKEDEVNMLIYSMGNEADDILRSFTLSEPEVRAGQSQVRCSLRQEMQHYLRACSFQHVQTGGRRTHRHVHHSPLFPRRALWLQWSSWRNDKGQESSWEYAMASYPWRGLADSLLWIAGPLSLLSTLLNELVVWS